MFVSISLGVAFLLAPKALAKFTMNTAADSKPTSEAFVSMATKVAPYDFSIEPANTVPKPSPALTRKKAPAKLGLGGSCSSEHGGFLMDGSPGSAPCDVRPAEPLNSESAIDSDTDDSFDEDSNRGNSSVDVNLFRRVESKANLVSRRSLITLMFAQTERQQQASHSASATTAPGATPNDDDED